MKNILIAGNHTCGNRGDSAILRGLIQVLQLHYPSTKLTVLSRFPNSSSFLLQHPVKKDNLHAYRATTKKGFMGRLKRFLSNKLISRVLNAKTLNKGLLSHFPLPHSFTNYIDELENYDLVIQVGGSFFVDMYGVSQFDNALCALIAKKPLLILGHSVGPFENKLFHQVATTVFSKCDSLGLREEVSLALLEQSGLPTTKLTIGTDTAWSVEAKPALDLVKYGSKPFIAITVRDLHPFDKRLNISQQDYEKAFANLCDYLISQGLHVLALSTCTGIDGYPKDDRMVALRIKEACKQPEHISVLMDEFNDVELGQVLASCELTIGTRLHSAIISMNFGTPAFALNYEHKSQGIMENLSLPELAHSVHSLLDGSLQNAVSEALQNIPDLTEKVTNAVIIERERSEQFILNALNKVEIS